MIRFERCFVADLRSVVRWTNSKVEDEYRLKDVPQLDTSSGILYPQQSGVELASDLDVFAKVQAYRTLTFIINTRLTV